MRLKVRADGDYYRFVIEGDGYTAHESPVPYETADRTHPAVYIANKL